ncbi:GNAT family N-acetyltransferase [Sedimentibacter sp. zth1]|uniref:GNAT family N-acetyltransferase n=1 Tax=Sedimentibacter sp. zth1 TaxID=2816908 RepID=UPI001A921539|nr:GNAT family N-acetyltransferase [Sedimentibacter sp. zth1]QSX06302.1 GNAT family N-acetyltransferase [Sedimentibacter sp. zth1]
MDISKIVIRVASDVDKLKIVKLSKEWEQENSTYGFYADEIEYINENRCFVACYEENIVGYIMGNLCESKKMKSIMQEGTQYFEVEEIYITPKYRNFGIGSMLFDYLENVLSNENIKEMLLSTATKDYESILNFYIKRKGMQFWSARLFKHL